MFICHVLILSNFWDGERQLLLLFLGGVWCFGGVGGVVVVVVAALKTFFIEG